jgi:hypothetical protein
MESGFFAPKGTITIKKNDGIFTKNNPEINLP